MTVIMLMLALSVAPIAANSIPSKISTQAEKGNDDTLYLRRDASNNLTTEAPTSATAETIIIEGEGSVTQRWVNETAVPNEYNWTIDPGTYNFTFWIMRTHEKIAVNVAFTFGYINATGHRIPIVTGQRTGLTPPVKTITWYNITVNKGESVSIESDSRLFIDVTISSYGFPGQGQKATFYYDGVDQKTRIITPPISRISAEEVSEFPFGAVFLPPALLSAYFILKRRIVRFRA